MDCKHLLQVSELDLGDDGYYSGGTDQCHASSKNFSLQLCSASRYGAHCAQYDNAGLFARRTGDVNKYYHDPSTSWSTGNGSLANWLLGDQVIRN